MQNKVPGVVYHSGAEGISLSIDKISLNKALRTGQMIFEINVEDKNQFVLVKEIQYHPVTDELMHIDFQKVKEDETSDDAPDGEDSSDSEKPSGDAENKSEEQPSDEAKDESGDNS